MPHRLPPHNLEAADQFRTAIEAAGLAPPAEILTDGRLHRFSSNGQRGDDAGFYVLYGDGIPAGAFGCWRAGTSQTWRADIGRPLTPAEEKAHRERLAALRQAREAEEARRHEEAAVRAAKIWSKAKPAPPDHPYLTKKGVRPHGLRAHEDRLVVPMRDSAGKLWSLQLIDGGGGKRFLPGGRVAGCYFAIGGKPESGGPLCICEGFATGATIHEAGGYPVAVAFNAGNLKTVALALQAKPPGARLILCADDDHQTDGNPGLTKAREAAQAVGGLLAVPGFGPERGEKDTDFNDLARLHGLSVVKGCIEAARTTSLKQSTVTPGDQAPDDKAVIERLAALSPLDYDRERETAAKGLKVRTATLDKLVAAARKEEEEPAGLVVDDVEPWPDAVNPAALLTEVSATVRRFIVCAQETADAVALWAAMTWFIDVVQVAPLAVITAPDKRCGKTQLLSLLGRLVARPLVASNISPAALFRAIDAWKPTLLVDEADAFMRENEELRGLLNCGHTRDSAYIVRVVGEDFTPRKFSAWGAKALAGIGRMADTLMDRSITLELRRKLPHEKVARLRHAEAGLFQTLSRKLARFADDSREAVRKARPDLPVSLNDRAQDNWEPLLAIAEAAGGPWPALARTAALMLSGAESLLQSIGAELLGDIQEVFETKRISRISTADLIAALCEDDEKPWATYNRGKSISPRQVANRLSEYGIRSNTIRRPGLPNAKGYTLDQFDEPFARYLASPPSPSVTPLQPARGKDFPVTASPSRNVTENPSVTREPAWDTGCNVVTDRKGEPGTKKVVRL